MEPQPGAGQSTPPGGYPPANPYGDPEKPPRSPALLVGLGVLIAVVLFAAGLGLFALLRSDATTETSATNSLPSSQSSKSSTTTTADGAPADDPATTPTSASGGGQPSGGGGGGQNPSGGGNQPNGGGNGGAPVPPTTASPTPTVPPVIGSFDTPENIDCHNGNSQTFTASWTTTNAVRVTISIDGAGVYKTYNGSGSDSLPFECSSPHTFLLTAYSQDGASVSRTITLQPRNVQMPDVDDSEP